ncbi:hypothetical protein R70006_05815 [Paraburkholderia domus]|uniref:hypothetical protein n=1 Tax=Paraburkholderia domus TaxID=2793075 RepID=UPI0019112C6E|nr:hypothetical protein [Paraburkholderia domus]MBK5052525.1 hypothetical protein [Burkholderia sp. R-70006]CAE6812277.1 hypothetical protein R70006_05815 [Paraburkholderia domus]CAE6889392.1 hypothetical protein R75471_02286 [Paraburkholderia domus]
MKWKAYLCLFGALAVSLPVFGNTASDNIVWSARPVAAVSTQPECTAYTHRQVSSSGDTASDPLTKTLKVVGTIAALSAVAVATKATSTMAPNPCGGF